MDTNEPTNTAPGGAHPSHPTLAERGRPLILARLQSDLPSLGLTEESVFGKGTSALITCATCGEKNEPYAPGNDLCADCYAWEYGGDDADASEEEEQEEWTPAALAEEADAFAGDGATTPPPVVRDPECEEVQALLRRLHQEDEDENPGRLRSRYDYTRLDVLSIHPTRWAAETEAARLRYPSTLDASTPLYLSCYDPREGASDQTHVLCRVPVATAPSTEEV